MDSIIDFIKSTKGFLTTALELCNTLESDMKSDKLDLEIKEEKLVQAKNSLLQIESLVSDFNKIPIKLKSTKDKISTITEIIPNKLDTDISTYIKSIIFNIVDQIIDRSNIVEIIDDSSEEESNDVEKKPIIDKSNIFTILTKDENVCDKMITTDLKVVLSDISDFKINSSSNQTTLSEGQVTEDNLMILNYAAKEAILNDSENESVIIESQSLHEPTVSLIKDCSVVLYDIGQKIPTNKSEFQEFLKLDKEINRLCCIPTNKPLKKTIKKNGTVKKKSNLVSKKEISNIYQSDSDASSEFSDTKSQLSEFKVKITHMSEPPLSSTDSDSSSSSIKNDKLVVSNGKKHIQPEPPTNKSKGRLNLTIPKCDSDNDELSDRSSKNDVKSSKKRKIESSPSSASEGESDASISDLFKKVSPKKKIRPKSARQSKNEKSEKTGKKVSSSGKKTAKDLKEEAEEVETRKNIHKIITNSKLSKATKTAEQLEIERRKRMEERQKEYNQEILGDDVLITSSNILLVLEKDAEGKPLVQVSQSIVDNLKPHQIDAVKFLWDCVIESTECLRKSQDSSSDEDKNSAVGGCVLAHCMGLGKTLSLIAFMHTMLTTECLNLRSCLVICPVNTALNWKKEWEMWMPDGSINIFEVCSTENKKLKVQIVQDWHAKGGVLIIGYQMYRLLANGDNRTIRRKIIKQKLSEALVNPGPDFVVCDEGHLLKNDKSAINKIITKINTRRRIVLTGTPLQNKLLEYHTMVQFVKPNLLGTHKEFLNRFVNPIHNGQHSNSTPYDVNVMKKRSHILFKMLDGCVHRRDYSSLVKYLPPKFEYVIKIRLSDIQVQLYRQYISMCRENKHSLFQDHLTFSRIWTHPYVICMHQEIMDKKLFFVDSDDEDEDGFINDGSDLEASLPEEKKPSSNNADVINLLSDSSDADNGTQTPIPGSSSSAPPRKRLRRLEPISSGSESSVDEVVRNWSTTSRSVTRRAELAELVNDTPHLNGLASDREQSADKHWWSTIITPETEHQIEVSGKLTVLFEILRKASDIGDKIIIFSQSLIVLDIIEKYLEELDTIAERVRLDLEMTLNGSIDPAEKPPAAPLLSDIGYNTWQRGLDYDRMDGSTHALMRADIQARFNSPDDHRLRLFLISTRAGGMGINLVAANRVVIFDVSWNPSHDIQAIFRSYRFGQTKPVYVYRFVSQGTMEEKIYERQVTKQSLSLRVVDEQQISRYFTEEDLRSLYKFEPDIYDPDQVRETPILPKDRFLAELIKDMPHLIHGYHEHDSLLQNKSEEELTEDERKDAWKEFEEEKLRGSRPFLVPGVAQLAPKPMTTDANRMQQFHISMMLQQYPQYATLYAQNYNNLVNYVLSRKSDLNPIQLNNEVQQVFLQSLQKYYNIQLHARNNQTNPDPIASTSQPM